MIVAGENQDKMKARLNNASQTSEKAAASAAASFSIFMWGKDTWYSAA